MTSVPRTQSPTGPVLRARRRLGARSGTSVVAVSSIGLLCALTGTAQAAATSVPLGTAGSFAVLAGAGITNTGPTIITGDIGTYPLPTNDPNIVLVPGASIAHTGTNHAGDGVTQGAERDLVTAYNTAAGERPAVPVTRDLGSQTLSAGVYRAASSMALTGALTLDAAGNPDAVLVFQAGSTFTTGAASSVVLLHGAQACHVFWQVGSSATLGRTTRFRGSVLATTSILLNTGASVEGRVLARNGAVTLDTNTITVPRCAAPVSRPRVAPETGPTSLGFGQVPRVPVGGVDTGDGSTAGAGTYPLLPDGARLRAPEGLGRIPSPR